MVRTAREADGRFRMYKIATNAGPAPPAAGADNESSELIGRPAPSLERSFGFGPFRLYPIQRLLLEGGHPLRLGSRALDILIALVERAGELITKRDLMARVWPNMVVVEGNLTVHIAALRRALRDGQSGNRYLINIPGQGYRFVAPVTVINASKAHATFAHPIAETADLPAPATSAIVRADPAHIDQALRVLSAVASALGVEIRAEGASSSSTERQIHLVFESREELDAATTTLADA